MVFLQGAARPEGVAGACLTLADAGLVQLCLSKDVIDEVRDVLSRAEVRRKFRSLSDDLVDRFVEAAQRRALWIPDPPRLFVLARDPKDEPYINLAIAGEADYLVSRDNDLLDLARADDVDGVRLRALAPNLRILPPGDFLQEVRRLRAG